MCKEWFKLTALGEKSNVKRIFRYAFKIVRFPLTFFANTIMQTKLNVKFFQPAYFSDKLDKIRASEWVE